MRGGNRGLSLPHPARSRLRTSVYGLRARGCERKEFAPDLHLSLSHHSNAIRRRHQFRRGRASDLLVAGASLGRGRQLREISDLAQRPAVQTLQLAIPDGEFDVRREISHQEIVGQSLELEQCFHPEKSDVFTCML